MLSVVKANLNRALLPHLRALPVGALLDVGAKDAPYKRHIRWRTYTTLDVSAHARPDVCCDLHRIAVKAERFDAVIALEVLEHLYDPQAAVREIHRILRPGGVALASTRFIYRYHPDPHDYYRFAPDSLSYLFSGFSEVAVVPHGNGLHALWHIINNDWRPWRLLLNPLNGLLARIDFRSPGFPLGFIIRAVK